jgi:hypothetical protein
MPDSETGYSVNSVALSGSSAPNQTSHPTEPSKMNWEEGFSQEMDRSIAEISSDDSNLEEESAILETETILSEISNIETRLKSIFSYDPKPEQVDAIYHLINRKRDVILIAKTGF